MGISIYLTLAVVVLVMVFVICHKIVWRNCKFVGNFLKDENGLDNFVLVYPGEYDFGLMVEDKNGTAYNNLLLIKKGDDGNSIYFEVFSFIDSFSISLLNALRAVRVRNGETVKVKIRTRYNNPEKGLGEVGYIVLKGDYKVEQDKCYISPVGVEEKD